MTQKHILLIGMPAVGKSTYGKALADHLDLEFIDTDDLVKDLAGEPLANIINQQGIDVFAEYESKALNSLEAVDKPLLIATGGSSIYREEINSLAKKSLTVHLFSRKKTLANRIGDATKRGVVFPDGISFDELYEQRMPLYNKLADLNFSTDSRRGNQQQLTTELIKLVDQKIEQNELDEKWMSLALDIARQAESNGEVPIGAVLVSDGKVIGKSGNKTISLCDATAHAEVVAIREACQFIGNHRLSNSTLYVTLEPCSMCAGAIIQARIPRVLYAALDSKAGAVQSNFQLLNDERLNHQCEVYQGLYEETASQMLRDFFKRRR